MHFQKFCSRPALSTCNFFFSHCIQNFEFSADFSQIVQIDILVAIDFTASNEDPKVEILKSQLCRDFL